MKAEIVQLEWLENKYVIKVERGYLATGFNCMADIASFTTFDKAKKYAELFGYEVENENYDASSV